MKHKYLLPHSIIRGLALRGQDTHCRFLRIFCDFLFVFLHKSPLLKTGLLEKVYSIRKEFAPEGSKFFPNRVDLFQKGCYTIFIELLPFLQSVLIPLKSDDSAKYKLCFVREFIVSSYYVVRDLDTWN